MTRYGIQSALFSDAIHVGQLDKSGATLINKEDCTDQALAAVVEYLLRHNDGQLTGRYPDGTKITITATIEKENHDE
ncbi:hypothetical protein QP324_04200 [Corynebacterium sp. UMB0012]|uniref:DUF7446 family protein n=1 Tax=Corynebacterium sp. UMB0012 TaxID=3046344 RepID=UPI00254F7DF6|nr:hypothetical protein [Corynebacterium sp. UMB0012]MDK7047777.1 hypothetical protein [Corynebacterium sp. UMB0012]